ncbi:MAG TPA: hypothetical protein VFE87_00575 [Candidatus Paceibacterota bacterium]|nr:hypothetical protein [Candidatus Paceibacterota bacterium]
MLRIFSENIVFFDTEFSDLDAESGELLSIGMVKSSGEELYLETEYEREASDWVKENVLPFLTSKKVSKEEARDKIRSFLGDTSPYLLSYVNQFDAIYWYKLFGARTHPAAKIPIDFSSMLFTLGFNPGSLSNDDFLDDLGIDLSKYQKHNALDDARLLKEVYVKFFKRYGNY